MQGLLKKMPFVSSKQIGNQKIYKYIEMCLPYFHFDIMYAFTFILYVIISA